jgi:uncharacterized protein YmfQ (DUF2313 family)
MKLCEFCSNSFTPKVSYQIYCSKDCRDKATRQKITERYQITRRKNRTGKNKKCSGGCGTVISIYNDNGFCSSCMVNQRKVDKMLKELRGLFDYEQE